MPQIMAETFARGLLDKIMVDVLEVIDRDAENGKSWEQHINEEADDTQSEFVHRLQAHERTHVNYSKAEEVELIAKIVHDLRNIQIGDSRYVLPPSLLALEKQMKCAACNVDGVSLTNATTDVAETRHTTQGQGDTHQIIHAILEPPIEPVEPAKTTQEEKETVNEATNVTIGLLHQLIEELANNTGLICSKNDAPSTSKERIAFWEEKEEQLIRTIEDHVGNEQEITVESLRGNESTGRFRINELKHDDELRSHSSQYVASISRKVGLDEIQLEKRGSNSLSSLKLQHDDAAMEQILPIDDMEKRKTLDESTKKKKKRGLGSRLRKFFRAAFGRRKN